MKKKSVIEFLIVAIVFTGVILFSNNWKRKFTKSLLESGDFAIGTFIKSGVNIVGYSHYYKYYYHNKLGKDVFRIKQHSVPNKLKNVIKRGDQFLVIYNEDGSILFFDKPIKDSTDFKHYIKEFEEL